LRILLPGIQKASAIPWEVQVTLQFEVSEEEVVRIVRRREGYSLMKSFVRSKLSMGMVVVNSALLLSIVVFSMFTDQVYSVSRIGLPVCALVATILYMWMVYRLFKHCHGDAKILLYTIKETIKD
jgi:hypothetical protein